MGKLSIIAVTFAASILGGVSLINESVSADSLNQPQNTLVSNSDTGISDHLVDVVNSYVSFNHDMNKFVLDKNVKHVVTVHELNLIKDQINTTNKAISKSLTGTNDVTVVDSDNNEFKINDGQNMSISGAGKTDIVFYWNYARIYLSKGTLQTAIGAGAVVGGVYAPAKIVAAACGIVGLSAGHITSGIWFDYNYFVGVLVGNVGLQ